MYVTCAPSHQWNASPTETWHGVWHEVRIRRTAAILTSAENREVRWMWAALHLCGRARIFYCEKREYSPPTVIDSRSHPPSVYFRRYPSHPSTAIRPEKRVFVCAGGGEKKNAKRQRELAAAVDTLQVLRYSVLSTSITRISFRLLCVRLRVSI